MAATLTTTIRLAPAAKRRIAAAAKRRGVSTHKFILDALDRAMDTTDDVKLARLEALVARVHEAVEDELDYRTAVARWDHHVKHKTPLYTGEEVWRGLGLPD
jgi:predicted DNA-binding protein